MAKLQQTSGKRDREKKRLKKRQDKALRKEERKANPTSGSAEIIYSYVDENGHLTDTPPDPTKKVEIDAESIEFGIPKKTAEDIDPVKKGRVEFFDDTKGFGFIKEIEVQDKFFVHVSGLIDEIKEGDTVSFELERGLKGMNAVRVKKVTV